MAQKLTAPQARKLADAQEALEAAAQAQRDAKAERDKLMKHYAHLLPIGEEVTAGGITLKRSFKSTGQRFSLKDFKAAGKKVTEAMRPFISSGAYPQLEAKRNDA